MAVKKKKPQKKKPRGRPTKYLPKYCQQIIDYFTVEPLDANGDAVAPPYIQEFCLSIGINKSTLQEWVSKYPDFSNAYRIAKEKQRQLMVTLALQGHYNASFTWRAMMNMHGWRDKSDNVHTGKDGASLFPNLSDADLDARIAAIMDEKR